LSRSETVSRRRRELIALAALVAGAGEFAIGHFWAVHLVPQLGFLCLAAAISLALSRLWISAVCWAAAAGLALSPIVHLYLPRLSVPRPGCRVSVVAFNQFEERPDSAGAAALLGRLHPDILFADKVYAIDEFRDLAISSGLRSYYSTSYGATLILSRFPLLHSADVRYGLSADADIAGHNVRLLNFYMTRPNKDAPKYRDDYARLRQRLVEEHGPLILAGDGNTTPFSPEMEAVHEILGDSWDEAGYGLGSTFPGPWRRAGRLGPWLRIDYILHSAAFDTVSVRRIDDAAGAGHYPVWAELALAGAGTPGKPCE